MLSFFSGNGAPVMLTNKYPESIQFLAVAASPCRRAMWQRSARWTASVIGRSRKKPRFGGWSIQWPSFASDNRSHCRDRRAWTMRASRSMSSGRRPVTSPFLRPNDNAAPTLKSSPKRCSLAACRNTSACSGVNNALSCSTRWIGSRRVSRPWARSFSWRRASWSHWPASVQRGRRFPQCRRLWRSCWSRCSSYGSSFCAVGGRRKASARAMPHSFVDRNLSARTVGQSIVAAAGF